MAKSQQQPAYRETATDNVEDSNDDQDAAQDPFGLAFADGVLEEARPESDPAEICVD